MVSGVSKSNIQVLISVLLLLMGAYIYIRFRSWDLLYQNWLEIIGLDLSFMRVRQTGFNPISNFLIYNLPGGLYLASFGLLQNQIWSSNRLVFNIVFYIFSIVLIGSEIVQWFSNSIGTFDVVDVAVYVGVALLFLPKHKNRANHGLQFS